MPTEFKSYSQAGQDRFVAHVLANKRDGLFLDIGSNNPIDISNSYALESELGWRGLGVDNSEEAMVAWERERVSPFYLTDAAIAQDWMGAINQMYVFLGRPMPKDVTMDYLSLDIDGATLVCLKNLPLDHIRFRVITIETDVYRNGIPYRDEMRSILYSHGYSLIAGDVKSEGLAFEDWWCLPELVIMGLAEPFRSDGVEWRELFK